jgi:tRNA threonylcarbamoyladenosine biosynthesis protein TsaB
MLLLGIDTCGSTGSVALVRAGLADNTAELGAEVLAAAELPGKTYSALLILTIRELLNQTQLRLENVAALVVVNGPGSFTGVRVGVSAAKGLAEALGLPVVAISRLAVLAANAGDSPVCAALDAGRGELYVRLSGTGLEPREALLRPGEVLEVIEPGMMLLVCEESAALALKAANPVVLNAPSAVDAVRLAFPRVMAQDFDDVALLDGNYLRRSDAEIFSKPRILTL